MQQMRLSLPHLPFSDPPSARQYSRVCCSMLSLKSAAMTPENTPLRANLHQDEVKGARLSIGTALTKNHVSS